MNQLSIGTVAVCISCYLVVYTNTATAWVELGICTEIYSYGAQHEQLQELQTNE